MSGGRVYVVIASRNRRSLTLRCLDSLARQTYADILPIVVDSSSSDGTREAIASEHPEAVVLATSAENWWTAATNVGVRWALERCDSRDFILTLNDDTVVAVDYVGRLVAAAEIRPLCLVGSVAVVGEQPESVFDSGFRLHWATARLDAVGEGQCLAELQRAPQTVHSTDVLSGRGTLVPVSAYRGIGLYDEVRLPHYGADYEFSRRAVACGYGLVVEHMAVVHMTSLGESDEHCSERGRIRAAGWLLLSRKSRFNVRSQLMFALLCCPRAVLPSYLLCYLLRLAVGSLRCAVYLQGKV